MRAFLDGLDEADTPLPRDRRCLAALGPKMLELCRTRSRGSHTYFVPVGHTRAARELGADALLAPELACVVDDDPDSARAKARRYAELYLGLRNYTSNLLRHGFSENDIAEGGSDRLIDAVIPHGGAEDIAAVARAHLNAGADHVCLQPVGSGDPARRVDRARGSARLDALGRLQRVGQGRPVGALGKPPLAVLVLDHLSRQRLPWNAVVFDEHRQLHAGVQ